MKQLNFKSSDGAIDVTYNSNLIDPNNLNENYVVQGSKDINTRKEIKLFYFITKGLRYTLNEFIFFAVCQNLCLFIRDETGTVIKTYGACSGTIGDFNNDFNNDFFK